MPSADWLKQEGPAPFKSGLTAGSSDLSQTRSQLWTMLLLLYFWIPGKDIILMPCFIFLIPEVVPETAAFLWRATLRLKELLFHWKSEDGWMERKKERKRENNLIRLWDANCGEYWSEVFLSAFGFLVHALCPNLDSWERLFQAQMRGDKKSSFPHPRVTHCSWVVSFGLRRCVPRECRSTVFVGGPNKEGQKK